MATRRRKNPMTPALLLENYGLEGLLKGRPVTLYHGTTASFVSFDAHNARAIEGSKFQTDAVFFTPSKRVAWKYAEGARNAGLPESVIDDLARVNVNAARFLRSIYETADWEPYLLASGFWRKGEVVDVGAFGRHLGTDPNDVGDIVDHIVGAKQKDATAGADDPGYIFELLTGGSSGTPSWVYDKLEELGLDSKKYRPKVYVVSVTASNPLLTADKSLVSSAERRGYDSVVFFGEGLVDDVPEVIVFDPNKVKIEGVFVD